MAAQLVERHDPAHPGGGQQLAAERTGAGYTAATGAGYVVGGSRAGLPAPLTSLSVQPVTASGASGMCGAGLAGTTSKPTFRQSATSGMREMWGGEGRKCAQMEVGLPEVGPEEVGPGEVGLPEVGPGAVDLPELGLPEVGLPEVGPVEAGPSEVGAGE